MTPVRVIAAVPAALAIAAGGATSHVTVAAASPGRGAKLPQAGRIAFLDDFSGARGAPNPATWAHQTGTGWNGGTQSQTYTADPVNAHLDGKGHLVLVARGRSVAGATPLYTSARLISVGTVRYGTVAARIRMTGAQGAWPAFWLVGASYSTVGWPACGEIDVMEALGTLPNLYGSVHGPVVGAARGTAFDAGRMLRPPGGLAGRWHTYAVQWTPDAVSFLLDGERYAQVRRDRLPSGNVWALDGPQHIVLNIAVGGRAGEPAPPQTFRAEMDVDWVRVTR